MISVTTTEKSQVARVNALRSWATTRNRSARTAPARAAADQRFYLQARELLGGEATPREIEQSASALRSAWYRDLALKSARVRARAA
ncbi:MAG: hypothetical protein EKK42_20450 [Pseudonocardiaceae bacterium]|nr:MAG: hypothetical protein EKK42_20450 [Pseudonocardiaceae bacterium]